MPRQTPRRSPERSTVHIDRRARRVRLLAIAPVLAGLLLGCGSTVPRPLANTEAANTGANTGNAEPGARSASTAVPDTTGTTVGSSAPGATTSATANPSGTGNNPAVVPPRGATGSLRTPSGRPSRAGVTPTASTASTEPIKIAYTIWDTAGFTALTGNTGVNGSADNVAADQREMTALVNYGNATGGIGGRKIAPPIGIKIATADTSNQQTMDSYCTQATEDNHVQAYIDRSFMVSDESVACFARHHVTLVSELALTGEDIYRATQPYVASTSPSVERAAAALVAALPNTDYLKGATIGVVLDDTPTANKAYSQILAPGLAAAGAAPKDVIRVSDTDASQSSSEGSSAVLKFRTEGVDHVIFFAGFYALLGFANTADSQQYRPRYAFSDYGGNIGVAAFYNSPTQNANAIGVSSLPSFILAPGTDGQSRTLQSDYSPSDPNLTSGVKNCLDILSKYTGYDYYKGSTPRSTEFLFYCDGFLLWLEAARKVGAAVTPTTWGSGLHALGKTYSATFVHNTDFTTRMNGASDYRVGLYSTNASCKCFVATTPWLRY
jgi:hypothetical protein